MPNGKSAAAPTLTPAQPAQPGQARMLSQLDSATGQLSRALRHRLMADLRGAASAGQLALHYQPRVALHDGRTAGAEALLRWRHPRRGNIPPGLFIPIAERSEVITTLGGWVLREAAREAARWPAEAGTISVNVSARQLRSGLLLRQVAHALDESGLPPERLELELTETLLFDTSAETLMTLASLRDAGVSLALDDFGTGFASLSALKRLPLSTLKLDRGFVRNLPHDREDAAIVRAVRMMARALNLQLVAEGVETEDQRAFLSGIGCEEAQGYLFGRPAAAESLRAYWGKVIGHASMPRMTREIVAQYGQPSAVTATTLPGR